MRPAEPQQAVIAFLADPASHGESGPVERIDTHASILFLVGARAYKLKRAVAFSYLDYSTLALREAACRRELDLNRRTAPMLYLEVRAVRRGADGRVCFGEEGEVLDWLVVMRRFDQADLFDRMAKQGRLTPELMRRLADRILAFHATAERHDGYGSRGDWEELIEGNRRNLLQRPCLDPHSVAVLAADSRAALDRVADALEARRHGGRVRRCHGDLHLGNVCLFAGEPTLFDAIEFSDALACTDMLYDLAFLLMDLVHRGLGALANLVLNRTLDCAAEPHGLACLPLFLSLRAAIRAHVALARPPDAAADAMARSYFDLACRLLAPVAPRLVAVGGLSGSGKSVLAAALAPALGRAPGARLIRSDVVRKRLLGQAPETRLGPEAYSAEMSLSVYAEMRAAAEEALAAGCSVVLDATYMDEAERLQAAEVAQRAGVPFDGLWLAAPAATLAARVAGRRGDASDADVAVVESQLSAGAAAPDWHQIDASGAVEASLVQARAALALPQALPQAKSSSPRR